MAVENLKLYTSDVESPDGTKHTMVFQNTSWSTKERVLKAMRCYKGLNPFESLHLGMRNVNYCFGSYGNLFKELGGSALVITLAEKLAVVSVRGSVDLMSWGRNGCKGTFSGDMPCCVCLCWWG